MDQETLADHLRRATRNFTSRLPEERVFTIGQALAAELVRAHAEQPPRHPVLDPDVIPMADGSPRLTGGSAAGETTEDLFQLGCLLSALALGAPADLSWRLDGPPPAELSTVRRRSVLTTLAAPRRTDRYATAEEAARELLAATAPAAGAPAWPLFRGDTARTGPEPAAVAARLRPVWRVASGPVVASPILTADLVVVPATDGRLLFIDRARGRLLHTVAIGPSECSPTLADGVVHVGTDEGLLLGIDVATGDERYRAKLGGLVRSSPLPIANGVVVGHRGREGGGRGGGGRRARASRSGRASSAPSSRRRRWPAGACCAGATTDRCTRSTAPPAPSPGRRSWGPRCARPPPSRARPRSWAPSTGGSPRCASRTARRRGAAPSATPSIPPRASPAGSAVLGCHEGHLHGLDLRTGAAAVRDADARSRGVLARGRGRPRDRRLDGRERLSPRRERPRSWTASPSPPAGSSPRPRWTGRRSSSAAPRASTC